jgi:hypothetical protein
MIVLLDEAIRRVEALPDAEQEFIAAQIIAAIDDDAAWERSFRERPEILKSLADDALDEHRRGETMPMDDLIG